MRSSSKGQTAGQNSSNRPPAEEIAGTASECGPDRRLLLEYQEHQLLLAGYEIHDGLAQWLVAAHLHLQTSRELQESDPAGAQAAFDRAMQLLDQSIIETRRLVGDLRPPTASRGLRTVLDELIDRSSPDGAAVEICASEAALADIDPVLEHAVYRIVGELLGNARRDGKSDRIRIELVREEGNLRVAVEDWGIGFDPAAVPQGHFGLEGIRRRVELLEGRLSLRSAPGCGTRVQVDLPLRRGMAE